MKDLQKLLVSMTTGPNASPSIEVPTKLPSSAVAPSNLPAHQLCECAASGNLAELRRMVEESYVNVNLAKNDGTTPVFCAAENGREDCLQYLLERQGNPNACQSNKYSAMNATAANGHTRCLKLLISYGGDVHQADQTGLTPAFCATLGGHLDCCQLLLEQGAKVDATNNANWTPTHAAIERNDPECLNLLLTYAKQQRPSRDHQNRKFTNALERVLAMTDKNNQTVYHLAAMNSSKACLEVLMQHSQPDLIRKDKNNKTVIDVASVPCRSLLEGIAHKNARTCLVSIEIPPTPDTANKTDKSVYSIGAITTSRDTSWPVLEEMLGQILQRHFDTVAQGLKTKKILKCDHEEGDSGVTYALGLSHTSIKFYSIGMHYWSPGTPAGKSPYELLGFKDTWHVKVHLFGWEDGCLDALAYESLISVAQLQNYLRLVEQYKSVVFYGSTGSGKTYLARKLAFCLQNREVQSGRKTSVHFVTFTPNTTCQDLMEQLVNKGCLLPSCQPSPQGVTPIIVLDDLGKVATGQGFGDLLVALENRGPNNAFKLTLENQSEDRYYLIDSCYIIGTMDRSKNTGLELSAQQHFRWVQFRNDSEPTKHLLSRHLYRKMLHQFGGQMPGADDLVYKAVEWVICVWLRLNEGVGKLNLPDLMFGPSNFLSCPVEISRPKAIMRWLCLLWNHVVAPAVGEAVVKGSGSETSATGQQKVASTALYVLMQRAVVHGCPLSGQEKERYLGGFQGSNELEIKMRDSRRDNRSSSLMSPMSSDDEGFDLSWQHMNRTPGVGSPVKVSKDNLNAGLAQQVGRQAAASPKLVRTRAARNSVTPDKAAVTS